MLAIVDGYLRVDPNYYTRKQAEKSIKPIYFFLKELKALDIYLDHNRWKLDFKLYHPISWLVLLYCYIKGTVNNNFHVNTDFKILTYKHAPESESVDYNQYDGVMVFKNLEEFKNFLSLDELTMVKANTGYRGKPIEINYNK